MRKLIVAALVGCLALVMAAVALAETEQNYKQTYTAKKPRTNTGTTFQTDSIDEANPRNKQPKRVTNFDITFPAGTKIDYKAIPTCSATEDDFNAQEDPEDACPAKSKIGEGEVKARIPFEINGNEELTGNVIAFNAKKALLLWVTVQSPVGNQTLFIKGKLSGSSKPVLKTAVPHSCVPPLRPDQDCKDTQGVEQAAILTFFSLNVKKAGTSRKPYMRTPTTCRGGKWTFSANIKYADGSTTKKNSTTSCRA